MNIILGILFGTVFVLLSVYLIIFRLKNGASMILNLLYRFCHIKKQDYHLKLASLILVFTMASSFLGMICAIYAQLSERTPVTTLIRPDADESGSTISLIADSEIFSGPIDIPIDAREYTFDEAMSIFSSYRDELDKFVLGDNESFLKVRTPLNFPSSIGNEHIAISWHIDRPDIINYSGQPISENISPDGSETEIIATLSLGNNTAEICYSIIVYPEQLSTTESLISNLNSLINSPDNISNSSITLPSEVEGKAISFYKEKSVFPSMDVLNYYSCSSHNFFTA